MLNNLFEEFNLFEETSMRWIVPFLIFAFTTTPLHANELFLQMADRYVETAIKEFVAGLTKNERYPLLRVMTDLRFQIFKSYLNISRRIETQACSRRRNYGANVPPDKSEFCQRYDELVDSAKAGVVDIEAFEKVYFRYEPMLLREIELQQARDAMRRWIKQKVNCLDDKTQCGRDERGIVSRVIQEDRNAIRLYKHILRDLEKKIFPEEANLSFINDSVINSPCTASGQERGVTLNQGMVFVPEGTFIRGSANGREDEKPPHAVVVDAFWIDRCEVNNRQYLRFLAEDPYLRKSTLPRQFHDGDYLQNWEGDLKPPTNRDNYPVVYVSWFAARYYCQSLGKRLPSEAEWERAARAGAITDYSFGNGPEKLEDFGWYNGNSENRLRLVADKRANKFQIFDMHGNVWEWVYDWYGPYPKGRVENPQGPVHGKYRVLRGGSWKSPAEHLRASMRGDDSPINTSPDVGFRCASGVHPNRQ